MCGDGGADAAGNGAGPTGPGNDSGISGANAGIGGGVGVGGSGGPAGGDDIGNGLNALADSSGNAVSSTSGSVGVGANASGGDFGIPGNLSFYSSPSPGHGASSVFNGMANFGVNAEQADDLHEQAADFGAFGIASTHNALGNLSDADFADVSDSLSDDPAAFGKAMTAAKHANALAGYLGVGSVPGVGVMAALANIDPINDQPGFSNEMGVALGENNDSSLGGGESPSDIPDAGSYIREKLGLAGGSDVSSPSRAGVSHDLNTGGFKHPYLKDGNTPSIHRGSRNFSHPHIENMS